MFSTVLCLAFMLLCLKAAFVYGDRMYKKGHADGAVYGEEMAREESFDLGLDCGKRIGHQEGHECAAASMAAAFQETLLLTDVEGEEKPDDAHSVH